MFSRILVAALLGGLSLAGPARAAEGDAAPAAAPAAAPEAVTTTADAGGYQPKMWPVDQSWPKTGPVLKLPLLDVTVHLPQGTPNTYELQPELPGDGRDSHMTRLIRTSGGPALRIEIRFTGLAILDPCGEYWPDFDNVTFVERPPVFPPRFETKMGKAGKTVIACLGLKNAKRNLYGGFYESHSGGGYTTTTTGRKYQYTTSVGAAFDILYEGDFNSRDFATIAADLEAMAGAVQEEHGQSGSSVVEAYAAFTTPGGINKAAVGSTGERAYGIKIRMDTTPYRGFPYSVMADMNFLGGFGGGWMGDAKFGLGLGYFIADLVSISVHGTAGITGTLSGKNNKIPLFWNYGGSATVAVNAGQRLRFRGFVQPSILGGDLNSTPTQVKKAALTGKGGISGFDEMTWGAQIEWSVLGRTAANGGSKGNAATFFLGFEHRDQWLSSMNGVFIGYGAATGSYKAPAIDPKAEPHTDQSFFQP